MTSETALQPFELLLAIDKRNRDQFALSAAPAPSGSVTGHLAVRIGAWNLLFSMAEVAEIIPVPRITRVPGVKTWLLGIANLRGAVMAVADLQAFLLGEEASLTPGSRLLVVRAGEWSYGLLVDEILGMRQCGLNSEPTLADRIPAAFHSYSSDCFASEQKLWLCFSVARLLDDPRFLQAVV